MIPVIRDAFVPGNNLASGHKPLNYDYYYQIKSVQVADAAPYHIICWSAKPNQTGGEGVCFTLSITAPYCCL